MPSVRNLLLFLLIIISVQCSGPKESEVTSSAVIGNSKLTQVDSHGLSRAFVTIKTAYGNIVFKFYPKEAPHTSQRIAELVEKSFYDNLAFHRVEPNFVIQAGDPTGTGTGGSGQKLKAEFNSLPHIRGTVAMARANDADSADSQFYISLSTLPHLDGKYTVFGHVTQGMEFLDKIIKDDKILSMTITYPEDQTK
jgi:cyclophilin family peptidyl-prolyl cis-trans isomerase